MFRIPSNSSLATQRDLANGFAVRAEGFVIATIDGAIGAAGIISIKSITPKTITTKS